MDFYKEEKRAEIDRCNICGKKEKLTWDHIPPRSCFNKESAKYNNLFRAQTITKEEKELYRIAQNGVKVRSICNHCNNTLLGLNYDKELGELTKQVNTFITSDAIIPEYIKLHLNANKIARSIVGHLLAAKTDYDGQTLIDKKLRRFFLNDKRKPPKNMRLLYYIYPYKSLIVVRDVVVRNLKSKDYEVPQGLISCLLSYPIAFILCNNETRCGLNDLFEYCTNNINDITDITIDILSFKYPNSNRNRHFMWPCRVTEDIDAASFLIGGRYMCDAILAMKKNLK